MSGLLLERSLECSAISVASWLSARWWADVLDRPVHVEVEGDSVYAWLDLDGVEYGFHHAEDERNPRGGSPVVYWAVDDFDAARQRLLAAGCTPHRPAARR